MAIEKKKRFPLPPFVEKKWTDPVWSQVFSNTIIVVGGAILGFIWILSQSLFQKISFVQAFHQLVTFLSRATPVNNTLLCLAGLFLLWLFFRRGLAFVRKGNVTPDTRASSLSRDASVPVTDTPGIIERFGFHPGNTNLQKAFVPTKGSPIVTVRMDGFYGQVMDFHCVILGRRYDQLDCTVKLNAANATALSYVYAPMKEFFFYIIVNLQTAKTKELQRKLICLRMDVPGISGLPGEELMTYPVTYKKEEGGWVSSHYNIPTLVQETFGQGGWNYHSLVGFQILGRGALESITLS